MARLLRTYGVSRLRPPVAVGAAVTFRPLSVTLSVKLTRAAAEPPQHVVHSTVRPPAVTGPASVFRPVQTTLAATRATRLGRAPHPKLKPPAVVASAVTFGPITIKLVRTPRKATQVDSTLRPPQVIGPAVIFAPIRILLAGRTRLEQARRAAHSKYNPPATLAPPPVPPTFEQLRFRTWLTRIKPPRIMSRLKPPTVVAPPVVYAPIKLKLAPSSRLGRAPHSKLQLPTVVSHPVTAEQRYIHLWRAAQPKQGRRTMWQLHPPASIVALIPPPYLEGTSTLRTGDGYLAAVTAAGDTQVNTEATGDWSTTTGLEAASSTVGFEG